MALWLFLGLLYSLLAQEASSFARMSALQRKKSAGLVSMASSLVTGTPTDSPGIAVPSPPPLPILLPQILIVTEKPDSMSFFETKPLGQRVPWTEVIEHMKEKMSWEAPNGRFDESQGQGGGRVSLAIEATTASELLVTNAAMLELPIPVVMLIGLQDESNLELVASRLADRRAVVVLECSSGFQSLQRLGQFRPAAKVERGNPLVEWWRGMMGSGGGGSLQMDRSTYEMVNEVWNRRSSDDLLFLLLVLIHNFSELSVSSVVAATSSDKTGLRQLACMCTNCGSALLDCATDETCKKALNCLDKCRSNDQVCAYRCITSFETPKFEKFAQCILQKNNCMENSATIPMTPDPAPLSSFRGQPLTFDTAEDIFIGHLRPRPGETNALLPGDANLPPASWMVVAGQNPAYDYFSDQHQIFYREASRPKIVWYDPVFKVETLDGKQVWRRRHYRVRRAKNPGQFRFTVLDNGVLSDEYWRILDCADDLSWAVFYYSGAAAAAGTSYTGALVVSRSGAWPEAMMNPGSETHTRVAGALARGGIRMWEVYPVSNTRGDASNTAGEPPLGIK